MTSGVLGMHSLSSLRGINTFDRNGTTGDTKRSVFSIEDMKKHAVNLLENLESLMTDDVSDHKSSHKMIAKVCNYLKLEGSRLDDDFAFKQQLDLYFDLLRNILRKPKLSPYTRAMILEVIELRACNWSSNEDIEEYYRRKMAEFEANDSFSLATDFNSELQKSQSFVSTLMGTDLSKSSTKLNKPTKASGKTFLRDEVLIRNGDSGKVMGIKGRRVHLIEEMSDTVISFQKVTAGAKERLVQITGPTEESLERAKELIETTIKRNASPVPFECHNRAFESNFNENTTEVNTTIITPVVDSPPIQRCEPIIKATTDPKMSHTFIVVVNNDLIHLSTTNYELGLKAQQLLNESLNISLKSTENKAQNCEKRNSFCDSNSGDDMDLKGKQVVNTTDPKIDCINALDSISKIMPKIEPKLNRIQRSSSQGTVPIGRTSLRFMSKSVGHESAPKIAYERQYLMECSQLPLSKSIPNIEIMAKIYNKTPEIIRKHNNSGENQNSVPLLKSQSFSQNRNLNIEKWD